MPRKSDRVRRKVKIKQGRHDNVVCVVDLWYLPEEKSQEERIWGVNINVLTTLGDDYDPIIGGSECRCLLCRIRKIKTE